MKSIDTMKFVLWFAISKYSKIWTWIFLFEVISEKCNLKWLKNKGNKNKKMIFSKF